MRKRLERRRRVVRQQMDLEKTVRELVKSFGSYVSDMFNDYSDQISDDVTEALGIEWSSLDEEAEEEWLELFEEAISRAEEEIRRRLS